MTNAFASNERGDTTVARFELPRMGLITGNDGGKQVYGMPSVYGKPLRRVLRHEFEAIKAQENADSQQRQGTVPQALCPQRWQAGREWHAMQQEDRCRQEEEQDAAQALHDKEALEGITHQLPAYVTSAANPLCLGCSKDAVSDSHSDSDSDGSAESADESAEEGSCTCQQQKQQASEFQSHMEYGSMQPLQSEAESDQEPSKVEEQVASCLQQLQALEEAEAQLITEYPHGVPKRKLIELRNKGLMLPSLGFGFECNIPTRLAGFMHRS